MHKKLENRYSLIKNMKCIFQKLISMFLEKSSNVEKNEEKPCSWISLKNPFLQCTSNNTQNVPRFRVLVNPNLHYIKILQLSKFAYIFSDIRVHTQLCKFLKTQLWYYANLLTYLRIHKQKMHLQKCKQSLQNWMSNENVFHAVLFHSGMHGNFQTSENECAKSKNWKNKINNVFIIR